MEKKTFEEKLTDFTTALQEKFNKMIEDKAKELLEEDQEFDKEGKYFICYDSDVVNIGVGYATVRKELIQDEEKAEADAKEELITDVANMENAYSELLEDNKISSLLADILRSL